MHSFPSARPSIASARRLARTLSLAAASAVLFVTAAHAAGSGMPWEEPLQQILESVQGPVAKIIAVIIITTGLTLAFGEKIGSPGRIRTSDQPVNSRLLYH